MERATTATRQAEAEERVGLPQPLAELEDRFGLPPSRWVDIDGPVHHRVWEGPAGGPTFVCVHGLGGSHLNWMAVAPELAKHGRVVALDLAGFGHTPRAGRASTVFANRRLLSRFMEQMVEGPRILIGNSMGGGISIMQAGVEPGSVDGLVLVDPILPWARGGVPGSIVIAAFAVYRVPGLGERFMNTRFKKMSSEQLITESLKIIAADHRTIPPEVMQAHILLAESRRNHDDAVPAFLEAARSLMSLGTRPVLVKRIMDRISAPVLIVHGDRDRLVPLAFAQAVVRKYPSWRLSVIHGVGHAPQMEAPGRWLDAVEGWLATSPPVRLAD